MAKGNVLFGTTLTMRSLQKTFSLAVSRAMAPAARIVCYAMKDGEILTDSLNFYVMDTRLTQVSGRFTNEGNRKCVTPKRKLLSLFVEHG